MERKFNAGNILLTKRISDRISSDSSFRSFVLISLERYLNQEWCDGVEANADAFVKSNTIALEKGLKLCGAYTKPDSNEVIWIITDADRKVTTILFPSEY